MGRDSITLRLQDTRVHEERENNERGSPIHIAMDVVIRNDTFGPMDAYVIRVDSSSEQEWVSESISGWLLPPRHHQMFPTISRHLLERIEPVSESRTLAFRHFVDPEQHQHVRARTQFMPLFVVHSGKLQRAYVAIALVAFSWGHGVRLPVRIKRTLVEVKSPEVSQTDRLPYGWFDGDQSDRYR